MGKITTIKGSLFDAPKGSIIIHACNTKGVWGAGIAREFARRFPKAKTAYVKACQEHGSSLIGTCLLIPDKDYVIGCLFTSRGFGGFKDSKENILIYTRLAVADLVYQNNKGLNLPLHMCKINSGLFGVPWQETKKILKVGQQEYTVYDF